MYVSCFVSQFDHQWGVAITMSGERRRYFSYLLRLWRDDDVSPWRSSLEYPHNRERKSFANLEGLCEFLHKQLQVEEKDVKILFKTRNKETNDKA